MGSQELATCFGIALLRNVLSTTMSNDHIPVSGAAAAADARVALRRAPGCAGAPSSSADAQPVLQLALVIAETLNCQHDYNHTWYDPQACMRLSWRKLTAVFF